MDDKKVDQVLDRVNPEKRALLKAIVVGTAFAVPTIASFSMDGLSVYTVHAQNTTSPIT